MSIDFLFGRYDEMYVEEEMKHGFSRVSVKANKVIGSYDRKRFLQNVPLLLMFIPVFLYFVLMKYVPMGGLVIAFKNYNMADGILGSEWVGFKNFELIFSGVNTLRIIRNSFLLSFLSVFFSFPVPVFLAIMINEIDNILYKKTVQTIVYLPHFFSWVIIGGIIVGIFSQETGIVNVWVKAIWGEPYPFLYRVPSWITIFVASDIWKDAGFGAIIYLAALSSIDTTLYEAAKMDGATKMKQIFYITIPGILPTIIVVFILSIGRVMEVGFDKVFVLQNSVVNTYADVISTYIYRVGLQGSQFSITTAMGLFESLIGLLFVVGSNKIAKKFGEGLW